MEVESRELTGRQNMRKTKWYVLCAATAAVLMVSGCQADSGNGGQTATVSDASASGTESTGENGNTGSTGGTVVGQNYISSSKKLTEIPLTNLGKISLPDYSTVNISMPKTDVTVTDADVNSYLNAKLASELKEVSGRGAKKGDTVTVDFLGLVDGKSFSGNKGTDYQVVLGSGQMMDEFEAALYDAKSGDKVNATVNFPEDYTSEEVAGKTAKFEITVKKIQEPSTLDEEFIRNHTKTGAVTEADYREELRKEVETMYHNQISYTAYSLAISQIAANATLEPSEAFLSYLYRYYQNDFNAYLESANITLEDYKTSTGLDDAGVEESIWTLVNENVAKFMVMRQIIEDQGLGDPEEMRNKAVAFVTEMSGTEFTGDLFSETYDGYEPVMELQATTYDFLKDRIQITYQDTSQTGSQAQN